MLDSSFNNKGLLFTSKFSGSHSSILYLVFSSNMPAYLATSINHWTIFLGSVSYLGRQAPFCHIINFPNICHSVCINLSLSVLRKDGAWLLFFPSLTTFNIFNWRNIVVGSVHWKTPLVRVFCNKFKRWIAHVEIPWQRPLNEGW